MTPDDDHRIAAQLARLMAVICVRNSRLEDLHAGRVPVSRTGDGSDVVIEDSDGNRIRGPRFPGSMTRRCGR
mgnify:CR=1 FL=1